MWGVDPRVIMYYILFHHEGRGRTNDCQYIWLGRTYSLISFTNIDIKIQNELNINKISSRKLEMKIGGNISCKGGHDKEQK